MNITNIRHRHDLSEVINACVALDNMMIPCILYVALVLHSGTITSAFRSHNVVVENKMSQNISAWAGDGPQSYEKHVTSQWAGVTEINPTTGVVATTQDDSELPFLFCFP